MIKPALTAEEWGEREVEWAVVDDSDGWAHIEDLPGDESLVYVGVFDDEGIAMAGTYVDRRKTAALCLHEQAGGFNRTDVTMHREAAQACFTSRQTVGPGSLEHWHNSMADRIEALLPPESLRSDG